MRVAFDKKLSMVRFRYGANLLLRHVGLALLAAGVALTICVLVERLLAVTVLTAWTVGSGAAVAVAVTGAWWFRKRPSRMQTALLIDERLRFHERFSTALALAGQQDAFSRAAVAEAHQAARGADIKGQFPVRPTRRWMAAGVVWVLAGAAMLLMPNVDLMGYLAERLDHDEQARKLEQAKADVKKATGSVQATVSRLGDPALADDLAKLGEIHPAAKPAEIRRTAIRKLTDLSRKLEQMRDGPKMSAARKLGESMKRLRGTPEGLSRELNEKIAKGDFAAAAKLVRDLQAKAQSGELTDTEKQALDKQLADLARQLDALAERNDALREDLAAAGLNEDLAALDAEAFREALEKAGMSEEQIERMMKQAEASRGACEQMGDLSEAMGNCRNSAGQLSLDEMGELAEMLDALETAQQELALSEAGFDEIGRAVALLGEGEGDGEGQDGELVAVPGRGAFRPGDSSQPGLGTGGPGKGSGRSPDGDGGQTGLLKTRVTGKTLEGPIIASTFVKGPQVKGEAKRKLVKAVQAGKDRAADAIDEHEIPRRYEGPVKKYFAGLEEAVKESGKEE